MIILRYLETANILFLFLLPIDLASIDNTFGQQLLHCFLSIADFLFYHSYHSIILSTFIDWKSTMNNCPISFLFTYSSIYLH